MSILRSLQNASYAHPYFQKYPGNFTFSLFLTECPVPGSMFRRRLSFFVGKSIREYFMDKSWTFHGFFSYVGKYRIIVTPINLYDFSNKFDIIFSLILLLLPTHKLTLYHEITTNWFNYCKVSSLSHNNYYYLYS
jgi:hypothetical protein